MGNKFTIELNPKTRTAVIIDNESKKQYQAKLEPYHRDEKLCLQVNYKKSGLKVEGKGIIQVPRNANGKFKLKFESNLDSRRAVTNDLALEDFE